MVVATFNGNLDTTIVRNFPTNASVETDLITFYNDLSSHVHRIH